jgi:hypothetical protein
MIRQALISDSNVILTIVNEGYSIEKGNTGIAFKKTDRYSNINQVINDIKLKDAYLVLENEENKAIIGCMGIDILKDHVI